MLAKQSRGQLELARNKEAKWSEAFPGIAKSRLQKAAWQRALWPLLLEP